MSLAPMIHPSIRGVEGRRRDVSPTCVVPGCISLAQHGHHMWARSYLRGQPTEWVSLPSGRIVTNVVGLCIRHHSQVTGEVGGHKAMIRLEEDETFIWLTAQTGKSAPPYSITGTQWISDGAINPQPWYEVADEAPIVKKKAHLHLDPGQTCGSCGYTQPRKAKPGPKRKTVAWTARVPDDAENGAEELDLLTENIGRRIGLDGDMKIGTARYHALMALAAFYYANETTFIEDWKEASET